MPREQREQRKRDKLEKLKKVILTRFQHSFISFQMKILKVNYRSSRCSHGVLITFFPRRLWQATTSMRNRYSLKLMYKKIVSLLIKSDQRFRRWIPTNASIGILSLRRQIQPAIFNCTGQNILRILIGLAPQKDRLREE